MVVLFLAGDHFLGAALERDPELLERALAKKVLLATPLTLVSVLKGIAYGWRQERLAQNADELRRISAEFYERVRAFADFYADSGRHLAKAVDAYNRSVGRGTRMQPSLKRMRELGGSGGTRPSRAYRSGVLATRRAQRSPSLYTRYQRDAPFLFVPLPARGMRRWMETSSVSQKVHQRFIAGRNPRRGARRYAPDLSSEKILSTLDHLGENVTSLDEAAASRDAYLGALDGIARENLPPRFRSSSPRSASISPKRRASKTSGAGSRAKATGDEHRNRHGIDRVHRSDAARRRSASRESALHAGVIQAYLFRSEADIERMNRLRIPVRLCKGAYHEPHCGRVRRISGMWIAIT